MRLRGFNSIPSFKWIFYSFQIILHNKLSLPLRLGPGSMHGGVVVDFCTFLYKFFTQGGISPKLSNLIKNQLFLSIDNNHFPLPYTKYIHRCNLQLLNINFEDIFGFKGKRTYYLPGGMGPHFLPNESPELH